MTAVLISALVVMGVLAQIYRVQRDYFSKELLAQYDWIDDIIKELEDKTEK